MRDLVTGVRSGEEAGWLAGKEIGWLVGFPAYFPACLSPIFPADQPAG